MSMNLLSAVCGATGHKIFIICREFGRISVLVEFTDFAAGEKVCTVFAIKPLYKE
jgi:hypothetical protein